MRVATWLPRDLRAGLRAIDRARPGSPASPRPELKDLLARTDLAIDSGSDRLAAPGPADREAKPARLHVRRAWRVFAPALAGAAVLAIVIGVLVSVKQPAAPPRPGPQLRPGQQPFVVPSAPAGFTANEFRMASPFGAEAIGGAPLPSPVCRAGQISATAATRGTEGGVLGVIHLVGAVVKHRDGVPVRCAIPGTRGPSALIGANGHRLSVPLSSERPTSPPSNPRPDLALHSGNAIWGFAWLGSYCDAPADAIEIPFERAGAIGPLRVPLRGPQPGCASTGHGSTLIRGIGGLTGQPVAPPRPEYASLRLTGQIQPGTTTRQLAPIDLTLRTVGSAAITLDPCPALAGRDYATARSGGFSDPIPSAYLPCTARAAVIDPQHPLHWTIPAMSLALETSTGAISGSTVTVQLGMAGVPLLKLTTTAHR